MLTHLEISGFKSFPDRTLLEFVPGITGIVGPNGSGKSNVVDAIRWTLGEQSARSMRGAGMGDVLFKGSASRRAVQVAEVTLLLDNRAARFSTDAPEIRVTRRLSRQGHSEYLINGVNCRLKDIKDLFLGSGAGSDSFCVIQQGQVAALLQASPIERRALFEEAAGVSRYKASREESRRKLDRVDTHLQRLVDLKEELDRRVQSARLQASKAVKWEELQAQLRGALLDQLVSLWLEAAKSLEGVTRRLEELDSSRSGDGQALELGNLSLLQDSAARDEAELREAEKTETGARQELAATRVNLDREFQAFEAVCRSHSRMLERTLRAHGRLAAAATGLGIESNGLERAARELDRLALEVAGHELETTRLAEELEKVRKQLGQLISRQTAETGEMARLDARINTAHAEIGQARKLIAESRRTKSIADVGIEDGVRELSGLIREFEGIGRQLEGTRAGLLAEVEARDGHQAAVDHLARRTHDLQVEKNGLVGRKEVLEGLERSHEGFGAGVRDILRAWQTSPGDIWGSVQGLLADHLKVRREYAPIIELALGEKSQRVLALDPGSIRSGLASMSDTLAGRVGFLFPTGALDDDDEQFTPPPNHAGIVARASNLVRCEHSRFADLPERLLGRVLVVKSLQAAVDIHAKACGYTIITLSGEILDPDGGLTAGPVVVEAGILSRKAELREVRDRLFQIETSQRDLERDSAAQSALLITARDRVDSLQRELDVFIGMEQAKASAIQMARQALEELEAKSATGAREEKDAITRLASLVREVATMEMSKSELLGRIAETSSSVAEAQRKASETEAGVRRAEMRAFETKTQLSEKQNAFQIAVNRHRERTEELRELELELGREERESRAEETRRETQSRRIMELLGMLPETHMTSEAAAIRLERALWVSNASRQALMEAVQSQAGINEDRDQRAQARQLLEIDKTRLEIQAAEYVRRAREELGADLEAESNSRGEAVEKTNPGIRLEELRRQTQRLGMVNPEAGKELADLVARQALFQEQIMDLQEARKSLLELMEEANAEGGARFLGVFQSVAGHFQELFRKLFGGGQANLTLMDPNSPLDCGIEVVAKPPGKDAASLSLMSGGERTMTAVALLMAVFRACPSPFCVLDEVDAALDEGNVGRFTDLLKEFSERTQFIMITHHKRTMACADVLMGITMSEPGVSTRMAVRMEDWVQDGGAQRAA